MVLKPLCYLHTLDNHCAKYINISINERGVLVTRRNEIYLTSALDSKVISVI